MLNRGKWLTGGALLLLLFAVPVAAGDDEGFMIFGNFASLEVSNASLTGAVIEEDDGSGSSSNLFQAEPGSEAGTTFGFGYRFGEGGTLRFSFWGFDAMDTRTAFVGATPMGFVELDDTMSGNNFFPVDGSATVTGEVDASSFSVDYTRETSFDNDWTFGWTAGARSIDYEEMIRLVGSDTLSTDFADETYTMQVDGFGFTAGVTGEHDFTERFSIYGGISASFVSGDRDELLIDLDDDERLADNDETSGVIWDLVFGLNVFKNDRVDVGIEYQNKGWNDLVTRQVFGGEDLEDFHSPTRPSVSFHGVALNVEVRF